MTKQEFITQIARYVQKYAPQYGIKCCSAVIAQAILESGWGESLLASQYHNFFGLKCGTKWTGPSVNMTTQEEYDTGSLTTIKDNFRVYGSMEEGVKGYFEFIQLERYQNLKGITDPQTYLETIKADGYATSSSYVKNNMAIVTQYGLTKYDMEEEGTSVSDLWGKTAELMAAESGYLEKASESNLDSKTGNAGYGNYTKYARDINNIGLMGCQGQPWCAVYQFWINWKIFGKEKALDIMGSGFYNCASVKNHAKSKGTWHGRSEPKLGALVIFRNSAHIGRVTKLTSSQVYTNEGNTSKANGVVANGGQVADKVYARASTDIDGYVWIDYEEVSSPETPEKNYLSKGDQGEAVKAYQQKLLTLGYDIGSSGVDGDFGEDTGQATREFQQDYGLTVDGNAGPATQAKLDAEIMKKENTQSGFVKFVGEVQKTCAVHKSAKKASDAIEGYPKLVSGNLVDVLGRYGFNGGWYKVCIADQYIGYAWADSIKAVDPEAYKDNNTDQGFARFVGEVQKACVVHVDPKKASDAITGWPQLVKGNLVDVIGQDGYQDNWYKVCVADQFIGYAWADSIKKI